MRGNIIRTPDKSSPPTARAREGATGTAFWRLMDAWGIPDAQALAVIDHPPGASGKRPRFALTSEQAARLGLLREIGHLAADIHGDAGAWLRASNPAAPFRRASPLALMARQGQPGMQAVLHHLQKAALAASLRAPAPRRGRTMQPGPA